MIFGHQKTSKNVHKPQNTYFGTWNMKNLEIRFQNLKNIKENEPVLLKILCRSDYTLLQTSSRESKIMKNRFGWKFKNTVKMQSQSKWVSNFYN
jgi:hypothetical protein